jgi:hypothetical protein
MNIEMIAPIANVGSPKWNGSVNWKILASAERHGDYAGVHAQHMLQAVDEHPAERQHLVNGMLHFHRFSV